MHNIDCLILTAVKNPNWGLYNLPIKPPFKLNRNGTNFGVIDQFVYVVEYSSNQFSSRARIFKRNVVSYRVKI